MGRKGQAEVPRVDEEGMLLDTRNARDTFTSRDELHQLAGRHLEAAAWEMGGEWCVTNNGLPDQEMYRQVVKAQRHLARCRHLMDLVGLAPKDDGTTADQGADLE